MQLKNKPIRELIQDRVEGRIPGSGYTIQNADGPKATLRIYDEIGFFGVTAEDIAAALDDVTADELEVQINSLGGDVFDGVAIYNMLRAHPASVTTRVDSMAASIASVIAQAGDRRVMLSGSQMMIHEAWGFAMGNAGDMRHLADVLDKQTDIIAGIYAESADGDAAVFRSRMEGESWMDASEAVDAGLADEVVNPSEKPADRFHRNKFTDLLEAVVTAAEQAVEETENVVTFRSQQGKPPLSDEAGLLVDRLETALAQLADVAGEGETEEIPSVTDAERLLHEWNGRKYLQGVS